LDPLLSHTHQHYYQITPTQELSSSFYTRFLSTDLPGVIGQIGTCFGENQVSLKSVVQIGFQGAEAEIVVITHNVQEKLFRQALEAISRLEAIKNIPSVLRVI
jgi:homoserine dehydrogenase